MARQFGCLSTPLLHTVRLQDDISSKARTFNLDLVFCSCFPFSLLHSLLHFRLLHNMTELTRYDISIAAASSSPCIVRLNHSVDDFASSAVYTGFIGSRMTAPQRRLFFHPTAAGQHRQHDYTVQSIKFFFRFSFPFGRI